LVGVFDTEDEGATVLAGEEIIIQDGPDATEVQAAGWAGGETQSDFFAHRLQRYESPRRAEFGPLKIIGPG
jgi:hypothetical protein